MATALEEGKHNHPGPLQAWVGNRLVFFPFYKDHHRLPPHRNPLKVLVVDRVLVDRVLVDRVVVPHLVTDCKPSKSVQLVVGSHNCRLNRIP